MTSTHIPGLSGALTSRETGRATGRADEFASPSAAITPHRRSPED